MHFFPKFALSTLAAVALSQVANASIVISIFADRLDTVAGSPIAPGTLLQLVNLGADGVFNPIDVNDGTTTGLARYTSGDDTVLDLFYSVGTGPISVPGDFASTAAFDLKYNATPAGADDANGLVDRSFEFGALGANITPGLKLGLRWFPGLKAADYYAGTITLQAGQQFGQFTRQVNLKFGDTPWVVPADGSSVAFDAFLTADGANAQPGGDSATDGDAKQVVVPEPAVIGLSLIGAAGMALLRRRRA